MDFYDYDYQLFYDLSFGQQITLILVVSVCIYLSYLSSRQIAKYQVRVWQYPTVWNNLKMSFFVILRVILFPISFFFFNIPENKYSRYAETQEPEPSFKERRKDYIKKRKKLRQLKTEHEKVRAQIQKIDEMPFSSRDFRRRSDLMEENRRLHDEIMELKQKEWQVPPRLSL